MESFERERLLRLYAEIKLPGRAWLQFEVEPAGHGSTVRQTAIFDPRGFSGLLYWYLLYPWGFLREPAAAARTILSVRTWRGWKLQRRSVAQTARTQLSRG